MVRERCGLERVGLYLEARLQNEMTDAAAIASASGSAMLSIEKLSTHPLMDCRKILNMVFSVGGRSGTRWKAAIMRVSR